MSGGDEDGRPHSGRRADRLYFDGQVQAVHDRVKQLEAKVDALAQPAPQDTPAGLVAEMADLRKQLDKLVAAHGEAPPPLHWPDLEDEERQQRWDEMMAWVDEVLRPFHPTARVALKTCWTDHKAAVQSVTAAWTAWCGAYRGDTRKPSDPAAFLRDWLPALVKQLEAELKGERVDCPVREHAELNRPRRPAA